MQKLQRILVVEDEFLIALDLQQQLTELGYVCVGPARSLTEAMALAGSSELRIDAAVLDLFLDGERVDRLCVLLERKGIPFAFATGANQRADLGGWPSHPCIEKPFSPDDVKRLMERLVRK